MEKVAEMSLKTPVYDLFIDNVRALTGWKSDAAHPACRNRRRLGPSNGSSR